MTATADSTNIPLHVFMEKKIWIQVATWQFKLCCSRATVFSQETLLPHFSSLQSSSCTHAQLLQLCSTLCDPMDCSLSGHLVHGILQARILQWVAMPSSRESSPARDQIYIPCTAGRFFTTEPAEKLRVLSKYLLIPSWNSSSHRHLKVLLWT